MNKKKLPILSNPLKKSKDMKKMNTLVKPTLPLEENTLSEEVTPELIKAVEIKIIDKVLKPRKKSKASEREHYVNNKEFEIEIKGYYESGNIPDSLANSINKIANGLSFAPNFINYSYKDEMVGDAIVKMFSALKHKKFKIDCGFSPFSYFTTIAFHAFINRIKQEKKYHDTVNEYKEKVYLETMQDDDMGGKVYVEPNHNETGDFDE